MLNCRSIFLFVFFVLASVISPAYAQLPQISNGLSYLTFSQHADGTWETEASLVETTTSTVSVLETLKILNQTTGSSYSAGISWVEAQTPEPVAHIAERIRLLGLADVDALLPAIDPAAGGWGGDDGYETNNLDTILALQALNTAGYQTSSVIYPSLAYITGSQNADGGWGFYKGDDSNVYMTAVVSSTLQQFPQMTTIATAINKATAYLAARQNIDGGFGSSPSTVYETALAYAALVAVSTDATLLGGAVDYLTATQSSNGSWNDDPYSTALALKALHFSEERPLPPPPPPAGGRITGTVVDASTTQRLNGVVVVLESNPLINTTTDPLGNFSLTDVPTGDQLLGFSKFGYAAHTVSASVSNDSVISLGNVPLLSSYSTGTITGTIRDSAGLPLSDVAISVTGAWSGSTVTGADGNFMFTYVMPGEVTISATKVGYHPFTATGTVFARTTLSVFPRMSTTPPQAATGSIVGRVIDDHWGVPVFPLPGEPGVTIGVFGGISVTHDDQGYFNIPGLAPGTYQVTVGMNGFATHTFRVVVTPGVTSDLGTIRLVWSFAMTLTGKVTDASTGTSISGAEVAIMGTELAARTDFGGSYVIANIDYPEITIQASATGYKAKSYIIGSAPWTQTMDFSLESLVTTGRLTGTVVDASSNEPLSGVTLTLVGDPSVSATTNSSGDFNFSAIPNGGQQVQLSLSGYVQRTFTTKVVSGIENKVGAIGLSATPMPAQVEGIVWDAVANQPFAGVDILITGTGLWQAVTAADGTYRVSNVNPGQVTVAATGGPKPGYYGARFSGTLAPGGVIIFNPVLSTTPPPGLLKGTVTDISDNHPIQGATVILSPTPSGVEPAFTDASGTFTLSDIPVGSYTASITAPGYWGQNVNVDIVSGYLGETVIDVHLQKPTSSTTVVGKIRDSSTGNPIVGADVAIVGTDLSAKTDSTGSYTISGIPQESFYLKASSVGYDSKIINITTAENGIYAFDISLNLSQMGNLKIKSFVTDKPVYAAYETVTIQAEVQNDSTTSVPGYITISVVNEYGTIVDIQNAVWISNGTSSNQFDFQPGIIVPISVWWETGYYEPGSYSVAIHIADEEYGKIIAETKTGFSIAPTQAIGALTVSAQPAYTNLGASEQVNIQAELVNLSNVKIDLDIAYDLLSPSRFILHSGTGTIPLLPEENTKTNVLDTFPFVFNSGSGEYPIDVQIVSGPNPVSLNGKPISVAPGIRIEPSQTLSPSTVIPDGDKRIQININLKGVEQK
jgi:hypothetical protein